MSSLSLTAPSDFATPKSGSATADGATDDVPMVTCESSFDTHAFGYATADDVAMIVTTGDVDTNDSRSAEFVRTAMAAAGTGTGDSPSSLADTSSTPAYSSHHGAPPATDSYTDASSSSAAIVTIGEVSHNFAPLTSGSGTADDGSVVIANSDDVTYDTETVHGGPLFYPDAAPSSFGWYELHPAPSYLYHPAPLFHGAPYHPAPLFHGTPYHPAPSSSYHPAPLFHGAPSYTYHPAPTSPGGRMAAPSGPELADLHIFAKFGVKLHEHLRPAVDIPFEVSSDGTDYLDLAARRFGHRMPAPALPPGYPFPPGPPLPPGPAPPPAPALPPPSVKQGDPKTVLCGHWNKSRSCSLGSQCVFAHGVEDLVHAPLPTGFRTKPCKYGANCKHRFSPVRRCNYLH